MTGASGSTGRYSSLVIHPRSRSIASSYISAATRITILIVIHFRLFKKRLKQVKEAEYNDHPHMITSVVSPQARPVISAACDL